MLQKEFFQVQPFNPNPYWDPVLVNLSGAQKFEEDTVFYPGKYRIELAPGKDWQKPTDARFVNMDYIENIYTPFIIRAYCGSDATGQTTPGLNPYSGVFKVNAQNVNNIDSSIHGIDVTHIFGAGGGNGYSLSAFNEYYFSGGANCLGDGNIVFRSNVSSAPPAASGAGSCLHLLPVGGAFGTDYIRAYHASPYMGFGSAYGGAGVPSGGVWFTRGGNSPYGQGGTSSNGAGTGVGAGGISIDGNLTHRCSAGAYFDGTTWIDAKGTVLLPSAKSSYIKITYLGPLD